jgi:acetyl-CoA carboxylase biotin carboxyl carrier protein
LEKISSHLKIIEEEDKMAVDIVAHMPGTISEIMVKVGDKVQADDELMILEAMKMENPICAKAAGVVKEIKVKVKDKVDTNQVLLVLE